MKIIALLLIVFLLHSNAEYVPFGQKAVDAIFKQRKDALILFTSPEDAESASKFRQVSSNSDLVFTTVDKVENADHYDRFAEYLGIKVDPTPFLIFFTDAKKKYVGDSSDLSAEKLAEFVAKVKAGEIQPFRKSAPVPTEQAEAVKTLVGSNFKQEVLGSDKQYLIKIYAPWCGHCKTIAPEFSAAAEAIANNSNIVLADFDGTLNEAEGIQISGYPTIYWYGKDKTAGPVTFNGERNKQGILTWIKDHTEYEWQEPVQAVEEQL